MKIQSMMEKYEPTKKVVTHSGGKGPKLVLDRANVIKEQHSRNVDLTNLMLWIC